MEDINRKKTENKKADNTENINIKKGNLLDIKQSLFQELTTQSSRKLKNRDSDENTYRNPKYQNYLNFKNCEENNSIYYAPNENNEEKSQVESNLKYKINQKNSEINSKNKKTKNKRISIVKNDNDIMAYLSKLQNKNKNSLIISNSDSKEKNEIDIGKYNDNNNDSIYILSTQKSEKENEYENESDLDSNENLESHEALPFCHYHKYNIQLPKQYTCNFKNCSCCGCLMKKNYHNLKDNNSYKNKPDYIYPVNKTDNNDFKYRSVLDKFRKNKNNKCTLTEESNQLGDFGLKPLKPNNVNLKIAKKNYIIENSYCENDSNRRVDNIENDYNRNNINNKYKEGNYISEKESENSFNESSFLELPYEGNDDKNLKRYKNLVSKTDKKSKIHFSVLYYKRLNKSYNQIYSKDFKDNQNNFNKKSVNKNKNIEFLRE